MRGFLAGLDPVAHVAALLVGDGQEAETAPGLAGGVGRARPQQVHADHDRRALAAAELEAETLKVATQLAASAPLALRATLDVVNIGGECGIEEGLQYETAQFGLMFATDDMREGTRAFMERRKPTFTGR